MCLAPKWARIRLEQERFEAAEKAAQEARRVAERQQEEARLAKIAKRREKERREAEEEKVFDVAQFVIKAELDTAHRLYMEVLKANGALLTWPTHGKCHSVCTQCFPPGFFAVRLNGCLMDEQRRWVAA